MTFKSCAQDFLKTYLNIESRVTRPDSRTYRFLALGIPHPQTSSIRAPAEHEHSTRSLSKKLRDTSPLLALGCKPAERDQMLVVSHLKESFESFYYRRVGSFSLRRLAIPFSLSTGSLNTELSIATSSS